MKRKLQVIRPAELVPAPESTAEEWDAFEGSAIFEDLNRTLTFKFYEQLSEIPNRVNEATFLAGRADGLKLALETLDALRRRARGLKWSQQEEKEQ